MAEKEEKMNKIVAVSGGFDPIHAGHIALLKAASSYGKVTVILNTDEWLTKKKGKPFMDFATRKTILESIRYVDKVITANDYDGTVCFTLATYTPDYFANGGDRESENTPELATCRNLGIIPLFGIGGGKLQASSTLLSNWAEK
jgi:D-beta-D-heptose 7-phosphate kinase/D-beta-D-heptose 1-phosphate adenosyltransferase